MDELQEQGNCSLSISWVGAYDDDNDAFEDPLEVELADWLGVTSNNSRSSNDDLVLEITTLVIFATVVAAAIRVVVNKLYVSCL